MVLCSPLLVPRLWLAFVLLASSSSALAGQSDPPPAATFNAAVAKATVVEVAAIVEREYMDAAVAVRAARSLRRNLEDGGYTDASSPSALAALLTRDLLLETHDKHLHVAFLPARTSAAPAPDQGSRADGVRLTNAGVQRVEILDGNVGYLNLTAFWRAAEARDAVADAMRLLQRADALIIDMRQNGGGSPDTVALLAGYLFDEGGVPLFEIVSRGGERVAYATPKPGPAGRDGRRPVFVLTSARTFSAGEGFAFLLQERGRAEVIGERTAGAANPGRPYRVNALFEVTVPNGQVRAAVSGGNWEGDGVRPDTVVAASEALRTAHVRALRRLIAGAEGDRRQRLEQVLEALDR